MTRPSRLEEARRMVEKTLPCRECGVAIVDTLGLLDGYCRLCFVWAYPNKEQRAEAIERSVDALTAEDS